MNAAHDLGVLTVPSLARHRPLPPLTRSRSMNQVAIKAHGKRNADGHLEISYGDLFKATEHTLEALNGTLRSAKRQKKVRRELSSSSSPSRPVPVRPPPSAPV
ncbi:hypothetical protein JCM21900_001545 [Sporobolomyces salmonicolor]